VQSLFHCKKLGRNKDDHYYTIIADKAVWLILSALSRECQEDALFDHKLYCLIKFRLFPFSHEQR